MPHPGSKETKQDFVSRCIPILVDEGREQKAAQGACYGIWRHDKGSEKIKKGARKHYGRAKP